MDLRHNLPAQPGAVLGREREIDLVLDYMVRREPPMRLVTLTGPGGVGKTRLALAIAEGVVDDFADGVVFVDLAPISEARLVPSAIARTLGLRETGDRPLFQRLVDWTRGKHLLLVLDNFEQVADAAHQVAELLAASTRLSILVTSRARLRLRWEQVVPVPTLALPNLEHLPDSDVLASVPAVALFLQRAQAVDPTYRLTPANARHIAELCVRLDGLPLALELAAARVDAIPPQQILAHTDQPLDVLVSQAGDMPMRHLTMRRAIGWSYELLLVDEQALFRRLSVFPAGCVASAAAAVSSAVQVLDDLAVAATDPAIGVLDGLASLASKSLLRQDLQTDGEPRFCMLDIIRAFASEQLTESGELDETMRRFSGYFLALVEDAEPHLAASEQRLWLERLEYEYANLRAALRWCLDSGAIAQGIRMAGALWRFWFTGRHLTDGSHWLDAFLAVESVTVDAEARAKALNGAGNLAHARGDLERAAHLHEQSLALHRTVDDRHGVAVALNGLANVAVDRADFAAARSLYEESLALRRELGDKRGIAIGLNNLSVIARDESDWGRAAALSAESAHLFRELNDTHGVALSLVTLGAAKFNLGYDAEATALHEESLAYFIAFENRRELVECLEVLALLAATRRQLAEAARLFGAAEVALEEIGSSRGPAVHPRYRGCVAKLETELGTAAFRSSWSEGRRLRLEDAIAAGLALERQGGIDRTTRAKSGRSTRQHRPTTRPSRRASAPGGLTRREQEVAALLSRGLSNRQVAQELSISERTAETHVCTILAKLGLTRRAQLTAWALEHELTMHRSVEIPAS